LNAEAWESEFAKYRSSPEYIRLNPHMDLNEFKKIYWMEWTHRLWGRVIGLTFVIPTVYFIAGRKVAPHMAWKLVGIAGLIGFQGFLGWWMVKSGLKDDLLASGSVPRVSQYRLAAHLGTAFVAYSAMLLSALSILRENGLVKDPKAALSLIEKLSHPSLKRFKIAAYLVTAMVFTTAMSGALVAGLDAGLIYNEFPWMGLGLTPPKAELFDPAYSRHADHSDLWWRNMLENPSLVQLDHRILATSTFTAILALFISPRFRPVLKANIPKDSWGALSGTMHMASTQVVLGISTLIFLVPTWMAATHQAGALALLSISLILSSRLRIPARTLRLVQQAIKQQPSHTPSPVTLQKMGGTIQQVAK
jgi:cytochrome c oxidase assembly protein subunit 15